MIFTDIVKVTKESGPWNSELAWYSLETTRRGWLHGLEHDLKIHGFMPAKACLIADVLAILAIFLQPFG